MNILSYIKKRLRQGKEYPLITDVTPKLQQAVDLQEQQKTHWRNYLNILAREREGDFSFSDFLNTTRGVN